VYEESQQTREGACKSCEEQGVISAPMPPRIIEKCLASDQIVIDTLISKYCDHTPLYRQNAILRRATRVACSSDFVIADAAGWVGVLHWMGLALAE
jgi:transposase